MKSKLLLFTFLLVLYSASAEIGEKVTKAEIQSCSGCALRSLPEVKSFIFDDVPQYEGVVFKNIPRAPPELVLYTEEYSEVKRIPLRDLSREECNELLERWGFQRHKEKEL